MTDKDLIDNVLGNGWWESENPDDKYVVGKVIMAYKLGESESRKGMFTEDEVREWIGKAIASRTLTYALKEFEQYLTERKGRG